MHHDLAPATTPDDIRTLHETLGSEDARLAKALAAAVLRFARAVDKAAEAEAIRIELAPLGVRGLSVKSLYRKAQAMRQGGALAIVDGRKLRRQAVGLESNQEFRDHWTSLVLSNRRKTAPAYRALFAQLAGGMRIPGVGDWRDVWAADHGGIRPAPDMQCPYKPYTDTPKGWSAASLARLAPGKYALAAARQGTMAATMAYIPDVPRTRVGLALCQCVQIDDMWHEVKVEFAGNKRAQRVAEFAMIDVLTGFAFGWLPKPVRERDDGTLEVLRSEWVRYLIAHLLCNVGIPEAGCLIMGERGTASADAALRQTLADVSGGKVRFGAGGMLSTPLARGLFDGRPKGNPRYKGLREGFNALLKNELGALRGHMGGGRGREPEDAYGMEKDDARLRSIATALEQTRPGALSRMRLPYMPYSDFLEFARLAYDQLNNRTWHEMEGWDECGFIAGEWRPTADSPWLPIGALEKMEPPRAAAFRNLIDSGAMDYRTRRMSPAEAWASRAGEIKTVGDFAAPLILGDGLARVCRCDDKLQMAFRDETTLRRLVVAGVLDGGATLERGKSYRVWVNPLASHKAYVADEGGRYLGTAPVQIPFNHDDEQGAHRALGIRQQAIAAERKEMAPYIRRRVAEAAEAARVNALEIFGEDPVETAAAVSALAWEAEEAGVVATTRNLIAEPDREPAMASLDDFI